MSDFPYRRVFVTGATGFIGRHLRVALEAAGATVRLGTRDLARARAQAPGEDWAALDVEKPQDIARTLEGCDAVYYLVHQLGAKSDYPERERLAAGAFAEAANEAGVKRIVYLGGVAPQGRPSRHLGSRLETGRILRAGAVPTVELRAAMVIGHGSLSWRMVSDIAHRLPAMVLPRWLRRHSWPVAIDDVVHALGAALLRQDLPAGCYDLPGAERIGHRELLVLTARLAGRAAPAMVGVPVLSPRLSSYWIGLVTSVPLPVARELVSGLVSDLDPVGPTLWDVLHDRAPTPLRLAIERALQDESAGSEPPSPPTLARLAEMGRDHFGTKARA